MNWAPFVSFAVYSAVGIAALLIWWVVYDLVLSRGLPLRDAIFGRRPNPAVALDVLGGMLAMGILVYAIISGPQVDSFWPDLEAVGLSLIVVIALLALLRLAAAGLLRLWFGNRRDAQGDRVTFNNELFRQRNTATGIFSMVLYLILVAGLVEQDFLDLSGHRAIAHWNILGVWLLGAGVILAHSLLYLGIGSRHHILHECFHDNNPAAAFSLLGLGGGMLALNHGLIGSLRPGEHMFNTPELWYYLAGALVFVLVARYALQAILVVLFGVRLRLELVRDNVAWGILDGGLIFTLLLMLIALIV
ncbi:MAG: DUF350 domain-containing protein [bacterium]